MTHDRREAHFGVQDDTTITTTEALGPLPVGSTLADALAYLYGRISDLETFPVFGLSAFIQPYFGLDAVILEEQADTFGLDAWLAGGGSFGLTAIVHAPQFDSFGLSAYIVEGA